MDADKSIRNLANKLIAYLECDNANVETVYMDGARVPDGRNAPGDVTAREKDYRVGPDFTTGIRVVVEKEQHVRQEPRQVRQPHFRRGHFSRYRFGPRTAGITRRAGSGLRSCMDAACP